MVFTADPGLADDPVRDLLDETRSEYERIDRELKEISLLIEQSRGEVDKLAQRNATIAAHLRQIQAQFETVPRSDIKAAFEVAQDAQQRLFTMRGQLEKLQSDQGILEHYREYLRKILATLGQAAPGGGSLAGGNGQEAAALSIIRVIDAQEAERRRLSKLLHDGPAQSLTNFILQAEIVQRLFDTDAERARNELANLKTAASNTFAKVRDFIGDLRPMMLDDLGLVPTVRRYVTSFSDKAGIPTSLVITGEERRLEAHREVVAFRAIQELLNNARTHAQASQISVKLDVDEAHVHAVVEDNGRGFDAAPILAQQADQKTIGLPTLKERIELLGGQIKFESSPAQGTRVTFEIPSGGVSVFT